MHVDMTAAEDVLEKADADRVETTLTFCHCMVELLEPLDVPNVITTFLAMVGS